jgi:hypothetical protein
LIGSRAVIQTPVTAVGGSAPAMIRAIITIRIYGT